MPTTSLGTEQKNLRKNTHKTPKRDQQIQNNYHSENNFKMYQTGKLTDYYLIYSFKNNRKTGIGSSKLLKHIIS